MEEPTPLLLREECRQDSVIVALEGELDTVSECLLTGLVTRLEAQKARQVLFDLSGVQFLDTAGIRGLISAQRRLFLAGRTFGLVGVPRWSRTSSPSPASRTTSSCMTPSKRRWLSRTPPAGAARREPRPLCITTKE